MATTIHYRTGKGLFLCEYPESPIQPRTIGGQPATCKLCLGLVVLTLEQREAIRAWVESMVFYSGFSGAEIEKAEALATILDWLENGHQMEVRDLVTYQFRPHTIRYTWKDRHFCPGYYDCTRCAG